MTKDEASRVLQVLAAAFPDQDIPAATARLWVNALAGENFAEAPAVCDRIVAEDKRFPSVARFREVRRLVRPRAEGAESFHRALPAGDVKAPSCPCCGTNPGPPPPPTGLIERLPAEVKGCRFYCGRCGTIYRGTRDEWDREGSRRQRYSRVLEAVS